MSDLMTRADEIRERTMELCRIWPAFNMWDRDDVMVLALATLGTDLDKARKMMERVQEEDGK